MKESLVHGSQLPIDNEIFLSSRLKIASSRRSGSPQSKGARDSGFPVDKFELQKLRKVSRQGQRVFTTVTDRLGARPLSNENLENRSKISTSSRRSRASVGDIFNQSFVGSKSFRLKKEIDNKRTRLTNLMQSEHSVTSQLRAESRRSRVLDMFLKSKLQDRFYKESFLVHKQAC